MDNLMRAGLLLLGAGVLLGVYVFYANSFHEAGKRYRDQFFGCFLSGAVLLSVGIYFSEPFPEVLFDSELFQEVLFDGLVGLTTGVLMGIGFGWLLRGKLEGATVVYTSHLSQVYTFFLSPLAIILTLHTSLTFRSWRVALSMLIALTVGSLIHWLDVRSLEKTLERDIREEEPLAIESGY